MKEKSQFSVPATSRIVTPTRLSRCCKNMGTLPCPVSPACDEIEGVKVAKSWDDLSDIDTVTLYMNPHRLEEQVERLIRLKPKRVIFNPGTEFQEIEQKLKAAGIQTNKACTLVLLHTNQFEK